VLGFSVGERKQTFFMGKETKIPQSTPFVLRNGLLVHDAYMSATWNGGKLQFGPLVRCRVVLPAPIQLVSTCTVECPAYNKYGVVISYCLHIRYWPMERVKVAPRVGQGVKAFD
jgi:hypothetical protein